MAAIEAAENEVKKWKVPVLKSYLQSRGITVSQKSKEELVELVEKARDLSLEPLQIELCMINPSLAQVLLK